MDHLSLDDSLDAIRFALRRRGATQQLHGAADGIERVAKLVTERREELVLAAVGFPQDFFDLPQLALGAASLLELVLHAAEEASILQRDGQQQRDALEQLEIERRVDVLGVGAHLYDAHD